MPSAELMACQVLPADRLCLPVCSATVNAEPTDCCGGNTTSSLLLSLSSHIHTERQQPHSTSAFFLPSPPSPSLSSPLSFSYFSLCNRFPLVSPFPVPPQSYIGIKLNSKIYQDVVRFFFKFNFVKVLWILHLKEVYNSAFECFTEML